MSLKQASTDIDIDDTSDLGYKAVKSNIKKVWMRFR